MDRVDRIEDLGEAECLRLLSTVPIGRVVYTEHALLRVVPVEFQLEADGRLLLALVPDGAAARALHGAVTVFQADRLDEASRTGWSVVVHGRAEVVRDPAVHARLLRTGPRPWASTAEPLFVRLTTDLVTGRRLHGRALSATASGPGNN
ncbi:MULTISPECIES: pyridoxamine 5'-phosphate oxidase family protein [Kitasatospora]|uniref:pyridoxamine 5'-phosphate oxidase family protein n=1 Tax=Kitasatospora TaxID=2063 RepID=UPI000C6FCCB0|nr:pyridoxamine 5'-phosphate oxidase family protein [Kitasatospora sp. GP30]MDH6139690.1 nitroimidazol reductase NimA-like FMN-containing flavoprotein (pyridoxamine 5'-phosphate oxidase superfamily) [Kitasatospora sp. GP30]